MKRIDTFLELVVNQKGPTSIWCPETRRGSVYTAACIRSSIATCLPRRRRHSYTILCHRMCSNALMLGAMAWILLMKSLTFAAFESMFFVIYTVWVPCSG